MKARVAAVCLVILGVAQMTGDVLRVLPLKAIASATGASPAPKVFSAVNGFETYSTRVFFDLGDRREELTPEVYARLRGPYNRRNVYGAAVAFAPVLPRGLRDPVMRYGLCGDAPLRRELGWRPSDVPALILEPAQGAPLRFEANCP